MAHPTFPLTNIDLTLYADRWIAVVHGRVVGVGLTTEQAYRAAKQIEPKRKPQLLFIESPGEHMTIETTSSQDSSLKNRLADLLNRQPILAEVVKLLQTQQLEVYLVGGAVRDLLLGQAHITDLDFTVPVDGLRVARHVANAMHAAFYPLDESRGMGRVVFTQPPDLDGDINETPYQLAPPMSPDQLHLDFATFRGPDLLADLADRDFTINAMALNLNDLDRLIDPFQGQVDLEAKQLQAVSELACMHDPIRVLRAIRQATQFGLTIAPKTAEYLRQAAPRLFLTSPERQRDELIKLLNTSAPGQAVQALHHFGILPHFLPEVAALVGVSQSPPHHLDVFEHTTLALDIWATFFETMSSGLPPELAGRVIHYLHEPLAGNLTPHQLIPLAILWHDTGKPSTRVEENDKIRFLGHEQESNKIGQQVLSHFRLSGQASQFVETIIAHHMRPLLLAQPLEKLGPKGISRRVIYRFFRDTGLAGPSIALHALVDHQATYPAGQGEQAEQALWQVVHRLLTAYFEEHQELVKPPLLLNGHDLMENFGLESGPIIGQLLSQLREAQAVGDVADRPTALAFISNQLTEIG